MKIFIYYFIVIFCCACNNPNGKHDHHTKTSSASGDYADSINNGDLAQDTLKGSPERTAMANIGKSHIHIEYSSPGVKGRVVWGGLVPYDVVWVTGAHQATTINFSKDVTILGKPVKAGIYAFFTIPGKDHWVAILNSRYDQHLADDYNQQEDVARFNIEPIHTDRSVQRLTYSVVQESDTSGHISMEWEKIKIILPVKCDL
jgi:hypothetical protein